MGFYFAHFYLSIILLILQARGKLLDVESCALKLQSLGVVDHPQQSNWAFATMVHGVDTSLKYRGFLLNSLMTKRSLENFGSSADFVVLIGFSSCETGSEHSSFWQSLHSDIALLVKAGIRLKILPRIKGAKPQPNFAEMALLKITPWNMTEYDRVQYLDADVMPTRPMDCYFNLSKNTFNTGSASPLNSGWFVAIPNSKDFLEMTQAASWRLKQKWDEILG